MQPTPIVHSGILYLYFPKRKGTRLLKRLDMISTDKRDVCVGDQTTSNAHASLLPLCGTSNVITGLELTATVFLSRSLQQGVFSSVVEDMRIDSISFPSCVIIRLP
jgi:hypothetical protein